MAFASDPTDPADMTPEELLDEVAALLARGVLRLRQRAALPNAQANSRDLAAHGNPPDSATSGLDVCGTTCPDAQRG